MSANPTLERIVRDAVDAQLRSCGSIASRLALQHPSDEPASTLFARLCWEQPSVSFAADRAHNLVNVQ
jgi:hypothetical protein